MSAISSAAHDTANTVEGTPMTLTLGENLGGPAPTTTSSPSGAYIPCESVASGLGAFCLPTNGSVVYVGTTYYVTWDYRYFDGRNSSIYVMADYVNTTGGSIAYQSPITAVGTGFVAWTVQKDWLQNQRSNNVTLYINEINQPGSPRALGTYVRLLVGRYSANASRSDRHGNQRTRLILPTTTNAISHRSIPRHRASHSLHLHPSLRRWWLLPK